MIANSKSINAKYLNASVILLIIFSVGSQVYSIVHQKAFWLDEWFILYNIKFLSYAGLFDNLFYSQQFPRVYLCIIKFIAEVFNYNYFSLRIIPFFFQVINILLVYFLISKIIYPSHRIKALLFVLFFLAFHTTFFYFSQLKAYTADIFFTFMSIWFFFFLSQNYKVISIMSNRYLGMLFFIFAGLFFSYTFPIVFTPILIFLFFTALWEIRSGRFSLKPILPIGVFVLGLVLSYFTDLRFVLSDKGQYANFDMYSIQYTGLTHFIKSLSNIAWLFTSMFFFDKAFNNYTLFLLYLIKIVVLISALSGFLILSFKYFKKMITEKLAYFKSVNFVNQPDIDIYFLLLFFITVTLYFLGMLPLGTHRINYFCFAFATFYLINGAFFLMNTFKQSKYILLPLILVAGFFPAFQGNMNELKNTNINFDQKIYDNVGKALHEAHQNSSSIIVFYNQFYPATIMKGQENLMIKSHHLYKPKDSIQVLVVKEKDLNYYVRQVKSENYILLHKYTYQMHKKE